MNIKIHAREEMILFKSIPPFLEKNNEEIHMHGLINDLYRPNRSVIKPPNKPPIIPPTANIETAKELKRKLIKMHTRRLIYKIKVIVDSLIFELGFRR